MKTRKQIPKIVDVETVDYCEVVDQKYVTSANAVPTVLQKLVWFFRSELRWFLKNQRANSQLNRGMNRG